MIHFPIFVLFALLGTTLGAPVYGDDGGYVGYARYDPSRGRRGLSGGSFPGDGIVDGNAHPSPARRKQQGGRRGGASVAPPLSTAHHNDNAVHFDSVRLHGKDDSLSKVPGTNPEPLKDNYIVPHYDTLFGHKSGYKISDVAPKVKQNVYSTDYHPQDLQPYEYGYVAKDEHGNIQSKKEASNGHKVQGSYGYMDEHGLFRKVDYVADKEGFRARVRTNEPGTDNQNPADVLMESENGAHNR